MATIPGAMLDCRLLAARRGALWDAHRRHFGKDGDPVLISQADTHSMNPAVDEQRIGDAYAADEAARGAEYGGEFRRDIEGFVSRESVDALWWSLGGANCRRWQACTRLRSWRHRAADWPWRPLAGRGYESWTPLDTLAINALTSQGFFVPQNRESCAPATVVTAVMAFRRRRRR